MWRIPGLIAVVLALTGCATAVLETRTGLPHERLARDRTLVVADVVEPHRSAIENAIAGRVQGVVAAHRLPGAPTAAAVRSLSAADWDALIVASVADAKIQDMPEVSFSPNPFQDGMDAVMAPMSNGGISGHPVAWLFLDVSVRTFSGRAEIFGVKVRSDRDVRERSTPDEERDAAAAQARDAADKAARRMVKAGLFDGQSPREN